MRQRSERERGGGKEVMERMEMKGEKRINER